MKNILYVLLISMLPIVELRGAIPVGTALGLPWYLNYLLCCLGNLLPVPFILILIRRILTWMKGVKHLDRIALFLEEKVEKRRGQIEKYATFGLLLFVAVPLPGTGAWTGSLIAACLNMDRKRAMLSVTGGVLVAGVIITLISYGVLGFLQFLL